QGPLQRFQNEDSHSPGDPATVHTSHEVRLSLQFAPSKDINENSRRTVPRPRGTLPRRSKACWSSLRQVQIPPFRLPHFNTSSLQKPILLSHSVALTSRLCLKAENRNAMRSSSVSHSRGRSPSGAGATRASSGEDIYASPRLLSA
ncbi:hypothetical protein E2320_006938, partial [Naja naja]